MCWGDMLDLGTSPRLAPGVRTEGVAERIDNFTQEVIAPGFCVIDIEES